MTRSDITRLLILAAIWGSSFMFMRLLSPVLGPLWTAELRAGLAGLVLCGYFLVVRLDCQWKVLWKQYLAAGLINTGLPFVLFAYAALHIPAAYSAIINATVPLWGTMLAAVWLGEKLTRTKLIGTTLGIAGVAVATGVGSTAMTTQTVLALLACTGAAICYGVGGIYIRKYLRGASSMALAGASQLLAGAALLPVALSMPMPGQPSVLTWVTMLMFSLSCSALAYILYYRLIKDIGPTRTFTVTFLVPVFAMAWGALLLGEPVHAHMVVGGIIIVASTLLVLGLNPLAWFRGRPASAGGGRDG